MMTRYINANKIISHLNDEIEACGDCFEAYGDCDVYSQPVVYGTYLGLTYARSVVDTAETADVQEVVHAYWKETTHITESKRGREIHSKLYNCSNCDAPNGRKKSSYCHWCGAKMDGKEK